MILHVICYHQSPVEPDILVLIFVFVHILHLNFLLAEVIYVIAL